MQNQRRSHGKVLYNERTKEIGIEWVSLWKGPLDSEAEHHIGVELILWGYGKIMSRIFNKWHQHEIIIFTEFESLSKITWRRLQ